MIGTDPTGCLDALGAVGGWHPDVGEDGVRGMLLHRGQERSEVLDDGDQVHVRDLSEEGGRPLSHQVVILREDDSQGHGRMVYRPRPSIGAGQGDP
jgi:hypothetical protein